MGATSRSKSRRFSSAAFVGRDLGWSSASGTTAASVSQASAAKQPAARSAERIIVYKGSAWFETSPWDILTASHCAEPAYGSGPRHTSPTDERTSEPSAPNTVSRES